MIQDMAGNSTLVSVEEYLATNSKPACDYLGEVLRQKPLPAWKHGLLQARLGQLIAESFPQFEAALFEAAVTARRYLENERAWKYHSGERPREVANNGSLTAEGISIPLSETFSVLHAR
jgi:hypothetical protein